MKKNDKIKLETLEIFGEISDYVDSENKYDYLRLLVKMQDEPLGYIQFKFVNGKVLAKDVKRKTLEKYGYEITRRLYRNYIMKNKIDGKSFSFRESFVYLDKFFYYNVLPFVTVAVCTKDRTDSLKDTLKSLQKLKYPNYEVLVIDNAPSNDRTKYLVASRFPKFKYVREQRQGLDFARNTAIECSSGEIIAFIDDDAIADPNWLFYIGLNFALDHTIMCVTGLVAPYELENYAPQLFEQYGGFGRGFYRKKYSNENAVKAPKWAIGAGIFGTGANMAFRKEAFDTIGLFDPALDVGTPTNGGGDLDMFFRIIKENYALAYDPRAIVYHKHRDDYRQLKNQIKNNGIGFYSYLVKNFLVYPEQRLSILFLGIWWFYYWILRRGIINLFKYKRLPFALIYLEAIGVFQGLISYFISRKKIKKLFNLDSLSFSKKNTLKNSKRISINILNIDLNEGLKDYYEFENPSDILKIFLFNGEKYLGEVILNCNSSFFTKYEIAEAISRSEFFDEFIFSKIEKDKKGNWDYITTYENYFMIIKETLKSFIDKPSISIVIATKDRYEDLIECLNSIEKTLKSKIRKNVEVIVVDNNSKDARIKNLQKEFEHVRLLEENRVGLSYARNKGIVNAKGDIIISLDDDVIVREGWLENILKNFDDLEVACVTANVLPKDLNSESKILFETYGGLGRGSEKKIYDLKWFNKYRIKALPTWEIGATACAAFKAEIFRDPSIGLLKEELGAGSPTGCSEDTYLFYSILKNGYKIVYEPSAIVYHKHRDNKKAFRKQIYNYSKGHVAYHLLLFFEQKDTRSLVRIFLELPLIHLKRLLSSLFSKKRYPIALIVLEIVGNIMGPFALIKSISRVKKLGRKYELASDEKDKINYNESLSTSINVFAENKY